MKGLLIHDLGVVIALDSIALIAQCGHAIEIDTKYGKTYRIEHAIPTHEEFWRGADIPDDKKFHEFQMDYVHAFWDALFNQFYFDVENVCTDAEIIEGANCIVQEIRNSYIEKLPKVKS